MNKTEDQRHKFKLFDLQIIVEEINGNCTCSMHVGDKFFLKGGKLSMQENNDFCIYAIQSVIPLLSAKQRKNHPNDWIETDSRIICPDPACGLIMRIDRIGEQSFNHDDVSANKL